ncbi:MAG: hypothetical protein OXI86_19740 [Candidatus Poribacteria bacterium]|nr:hypothetical protein [Candidatus Poribacteria bacterium]
MCDDFVFVYPKARYTEGYCLFIGNERFDSVAFNPFGGLNDDLSSLRFRDIDKKTDGFHDLSVCRSFR